MCFKIFHTYEMTSRGLCLCFRVCFQSSSQSRTRMAEEMCFRTFHTHSSISHRGHHSAASGHWVVPSPYLGRTWSRHLARTWSPHLGRTWSPYLGKTSFYDAFLLFGRIFYQLAPWAQNVWWPFTCCFESF